MATVTNMTSDNAELGARYISALRIVNSLRTQHVGDVYVCANNLAAGAVLTADVGTATMQYCETLLLAKLKALNIDPRPLSRKRNPVQE
jgi:hypothetical protein